MIKDRGVIKMAKKILTPYIKVLKNIDLFGVLSKDLPRDLISPREIAIIHARIDDWNKKSEELAENEDLYLAKVFEQKCIMANRLLDHAQRRLNLSKSSFVIVDGNAEKREESKSIVMLKLLNGLSN